MNTQSTIRNYQSWAVLAVILVTLQVGPAFAATIGFEQLNPQIDPGDPNTYAADPSSAFYDEDGYDFFVTQGVFSIVRDSNSPDNFSAMGLTVLGGAGVPASMMFRRNDGSAFDFYGFDLSVFAPGPFFPNTAPGSVEIASPNGDSVVFDISNMPIPSSGYQSLNFLGVTEVTFTLTPDVVFTFDDLAVQVVPLPAALPLFGSAIGLFGFLGWRRSRQAA